MSFTFLWSHPIYSYFLRDIKQQAVTAETVTEWQRTARFKYRLHMPVQTAKFFWEQHQLQNPKLERSVWLLHGECICSKDSIRWRLQAMACRAGDKAFCRQLQSCCAKLQRFDNFSNQPQLPFSKMYVPWHNWSCWSATMRSSTQQSSQDLI